MDRALKLGLGALASAALVGASPVAGVKTFTVRLSGNAETNFAHPAGGTGDMDGSGIVTLTVDPARKLICYDFRLSGLSEPMMAHIHKGLPLQNRAPVIILFTGTHSALDNCAPSTRSQLTDIVIEPADYYVSVDTTEFPDGAVRGQLPIS